MDLFFKKNIIRIHTMNAKSHIQLCFLVFLLFIFGCAGGSSVTALTESGLVAGTTEGGTWVFRGIPYAAPPVEGLRWKPPVAVTRWKGFRNATEFAPACPQVVTDGTVTSEDCLYLNIWLKANTQKQRQPVMVFIHGGSFLTGAGSNPLYNGSKLAEKGVVVVTINYRLGPLGFFAHPDLDGESIYGVSGNYGLLDQIAALTWIKNNIHAFGGDSSNVTVFGESAGGYSVISLLASPFSTGLYKRGIVESAPVWQNGATIDINNSKSKAEEIGENFAASLGCTGESVIAKMRAKSANDIVAAVPDPSSVFEYVHTLEFLPTVDGVILPENPADSFANGTQNVVSLLIGSNANEGNVLVEGLNMTVSEYTQFLVDRFADNSDMVYEIYEPTGDTDVEQTMSDLMTGLDYAESAKFAAEYMSRVNDVYLYRFSYPVSETLLAFHGSELPFVFGTIDQWTTSATALELSNKIMSAWIAFASTGNPNGVFEVQWPKYTSAEDSYLDIDETSEVKSGYGTPLTDDLAELGIR